MNERSSSRLQILMLLAAIAGTMYLGDVHVGPASPRLYIYLALTAWLAVRWIFAGDAVMDDRRAQWLLFGYGVFVTWTIIAFVLQGIAWGKILEQTIAYHGVAIVTALLALFILRTRRDVALFLSGLVLLFLPSCLIAILQWREVPQAWQLWHVLRPHVDMSLGYSGWVEGEAGPEKLGACGLFNSPVSFGYYVSVLMPVIFRRFLVRPSLRWLVALGLTIAGLIVVQQRAALVAAVLCCGVIFLLQLGERGGRLKGILAVLLIVLLLGGAAYVAFGAEGMLKTRLLRLRDAGRLEVAEIALNFVYDHPFIGGALDYVYYFESEQTLTSRYRVVAPHNMFLNAATFYGVPGLLLILAFLVQLAVILWREWKTARERHDWTSMTLILSLVGYLIFAQFHNASFVTGDAIPWLLIALLLAASRTEPLRIRVLALRRRRMPLLPRPAEKYS